MLFFPYTLTSLLLLYIFFLLFQFSSVQFISVTQSCLTLCDPMNRSTPSSLSITNSRSSLKLMCIESVNHPAISSASPPAPNPSQYQGLSKESTLHIRRPKYWSFRFSISPSNKHSGLVSFRMDWLDLLAVQGTLESLLHTTVQKHQFFGAQLFSQSNSHIHT